MNTNTRILISIAIIGVVSLFIYQNNEHKKEMERLARIETIEKEKREEERRQELIRHREEEDRLAWNIAQNINTVAAYEEYVNNTNGLGNYRSLAYAAIEKLNEEENRRLELEKRTEQVTQRAKNAGNQIISKYYDDGINKYTVINDWEYKEGVFEGKGKYIVNVTLTWNGNYIASNYYKAVGTITFREDGSNIQWTPTYINPTLAKYQDNMKEAAVKGIGLTILIGGVAKMLGEN